MYVCTEQNGVLNSLIEFSRTNTDTVPIVLVAGSAGSGKSMILRYLARHLSTAFLYGEGTDWRVPITIPMQQFPVGDVRSLWDKILGEWANWANGLVEKPEFNSEWVESVLNTERSILILDSVDEFLMNSPGLTPSTFRRDLFELQKLLSRRGNSQIILGIRTGDPMYDFLRKEVDYVYEIKEPSLGQIERHFGRSYRFLRRHNLEGHIAAKNSFWSPFILEKLNTPSIEKTEHSDLNKQSQVFDLALELIIRDSKLQSVKTSYGTGMSVRDCKNCVMLIARAFALEFAGAMTCARIGSVIRDMQSRWNEFEWREDSEEDREALNRAFSICLSDSMLTTILRRTIFLVTGPSQFRFEHREWLEFLNGMYFAFCMKHLNIKPIVTSAFTQRAFQLGGEYLAVRGWGGFDISFVKQIVNLMLKPKGQFIIGNFAGLLGNSDIPIDERATELIRERLPDVPVAALVTFFSAIGARMLRSLIVETAVPHFSRTVLSMFQEHLSAAQKKEKSLLNGHEVVAASLCWCYLALVAKRLDSTYRPTTEWFRPDLTETQVKESTDGVLGQLSKGAFVAPTPREFLSVQTAYLRIQDVVLLDAQVRPISVAHYLYLLVLAKKNGVLNMSISLQLDSILAEDSRHLQILREYELGEVGELVSLCVELFNEV